MTGDKAGVVLAVVGLAHLQPGNLGDRVRLVGRLEQTGQQLLLFHWLWRQLRVDAGGAEKEQALDTVSPGLIDHVILDHQVVMDELCRISIVGVNPPTFAAARNRYSGRSRAKKAATAA